MNEPSANRIEDLIRERLRLDQELDRFQRMLAILYVDIVGSTRFYDEHGNTAGLVMVQKCLDLLMPIIEKQHGIIVKTIGDAILARFESVEDSIRSGIRMIRTLEQRNRGRAKSDEIHIHVGINFGLCLLKDNDVFGDVVNVAARIEGAAGVDEIVVSPSVFEQVRQQTEFRVRKKSSGVELKGKSQKLDLYTVVWQQEDATEAAPPAPTADQLIMASGVHTNLAEMARKIAAMPSPAVETPKVAPAKVEPPKPEAPAVTGIRFSLARLLPDGSMDKPYVLDRPGVTAGKEGDIALTDDPLVAAQHVRFTQLVDQVFVEDLGSPQGVYLRVRTPQKLKDGDVIQIGQQTMRFTVQETKVPAAQSVPTNATVVLRVGPLVNAPQAYLIRLDVNEQEIDCRALHDAETVLGRSRGTYTFPDDPYLSSAHARVLRKDNSSYVLEDLGSTNGTFLRIRKRVMAKEGDTILVGKQSLRIVAERAAGTT